MTAFHAGLGIAVVAVNLVAGAGGRVRLVARQPTSARSGPCCGSARRWWRSRRSTAWCSTATGHDLPELHLVYGLTPLGVSFLAEQLRLASADSVLQARGLEDSQAVAKLPDEEQRAIVHAIVRRETGVMAASALVVVGARTTRRGVAVTPFAAAVPRAIPH